MDILQCLYNSEINWTISCFWDAGFTWSLGDELNGLVDQGDALTLSEAVTELVCTAKKHYPNSIFTKKF